MFLRKLKRGDKRDLRQGNIFYRYSQLEHLSPPSLHPGRLLKPG